MVCKYQHSHNFLQKILLNIELSRKFQAHIQQSMIHHHLKDSTFSKSVCHCSMSRNRYTILQFNQNESISVRTFLIYQRQFSIINLLILHLNCRMFRKPLSFLNHKDSKIDGTYIRLNSFDRRHSYFLLSKKSCLDILQIQFLNNTHRNKILLNFGSAQDLSQK